MKGLINLLNSIKINKLNKKNNFVTKIDKKNIQFLKILIKINTIKIAKNIFKNLFLLKINETSNLNIKLFLKKKKLTISNKSKVLQKNMYIVSNCNGFSVSNKNSPKSGLIVAQLLIK